jgi:aryl-alcohol dehydrogenase-like predicted oxidoreductase
MGVRHFDTSPYYGHGIAERELGQFAATCRSQLLIATKFGVKQSPVFATLPWLLYARLAVNAAQRKVTRDNRWAPAPVRDFGAREARRSLERSLRALRTDYVDVFFLHEPNAHALLQPHDLLTTLDRLRREGKARYVGLAGTASACLAIARQHPDLAQVMQLGATVGSGDSDWDARERLACHFSFGHFRDRQAPVEVLVRDAITQNPHGVILYSSRHASRVEQVITSLTRLERD